MKKIFFVVRRVGPALAVFLLFPSMVLSLENGSRDLLREQVEVLDQARQKAAAELSAKEARGMATERDREHFRTVTTSLEQRIAECCKRLAARGGVAAVSCPDQVKADTRKEKEKNGSASAAAVRKADEEPVKVPAAPPEVMPPPDQGFWATVRQWWDSLFSRKVPVSGETTGKPEAVAAEQQEEVKGSPVHNQSAEDTGPAADPAHSQQPVQVGEHPVAQEKGARRHQEQQESGAEQAAQVSSPLHRPPAGTDQSGRQDESAGVDGQELHSGTASGKDVRYEAVNRASSNQDRMSGTADKNTGLAEKEGKEKTRKKAGTVQQSGTGTGPGTVAGVAGLEQSLQQALNAFDGRLLSEEERLAARVPKQREGSAGGYGPPGLPGGGMTVEGLGREQGNDGSDTGDHGRAGSVATAGTEPDTGDGRSSIDADDDIVARQLREAAEQETDPVLREKLWQEYKKYKQGR